MWLWTENGRTDKLFEDHRFGDPNGHTQNFFRISGRSENYVPFFKGTE